MKKKDTDTEKSEIENIDTEQENTGKTEPAEKDSEQEKTEPAEKAPEDGHMKKIQKLETENAELKDKFLRKHADFENFRKRMFKEKEDSIKFANTNLLGDLIPIIDDFERAINSAENSKDFETFLKGVELIEKQFASMLDNKWGLKRFDAVGDPFNPEKHEALMMEESSEIEDPQVVEVFQKGYQLNERVIRPAKVKVSMPAKAVETVEADEELDTDEKNSEIKPEVQE